jgi:hypothetical protein
MPFYASTTKLLTIPTASTVINRHFRFALPDRASIHPTVLWWQFLLDSFSRPPPGIRLSPIPSYVRKTKTENRLIFSDFSDTSRVIFTACLPSLIHCSVVALGQLIRKHLGDTAARRRSWCVSTDKQFTPKAADVVGLYLNPPVNAVVLSVDEKPSIQAIERGSGYVETDSGKIVRGSP